MQLEEADHLKQISITKLLSFFKEPLEAGFISGQLTFSRNGEPTGTMGVTINYDDYKPIKINFNYTMVDSGLKRSQDITITTKACSYGGERLYFVCPRCNNICFKVYLLDSYLKCRKCHRLTYASNNRGHKERDFSKLFKILDIYESTIYRKANRYPIHKGRYTRNYLKVSNMINRVDIEEANRRYEKMLKL